MMKYKILIILTLGLLIVPSCSVKHVATPDQYDQETLASMMEALENAITDTPYCALIQYTSVEVVPVPDPDPNDDDVEEKQIYHARVLETFRGQHMKKISYMLICEKGEYASEHASIVGKKSVITLCLDNEGFWYPGTGSKFPATEEVIKTAQRIGQRLNFVKQSFSDCE